MRMTGAALAAALSALASGARATPPVEAFGHLPHIEQMRLSPDGERVAFIGVDGDKRKIFVRQIGGPMLMAAPMGEAKVRGLSWAGDDHLLIYSTETVDQTGDQSEKGEATSLVIANLKAGVLRAPLADTTFLPAIEGVYGSRKIAGRWYAFYGLVRSRRAGGLSKESNLTQDSVDLYRMDLDTLEISPVAKGNRFGRSWVLDAAGQVIATEEYDAETGESRVYAGANGGRVLARQKSDSNGVSIDGLGRKPGTVLVRGLNGEGKNPQELDLATGAISDVLPDSREELRLWTDRDTEQLIGYATGGAHPKTVLFDPAKDAALQKAVRPFVDSRINVLGVDRSYDRFVLHTEGDNDSGSYYLVDLKARKADPLGYDYPEVGSADVGSRRFVQYRAADGVELEAVLTLPPGRAQKNLPVVVLPHGGPRAADEIAFDWWAEAFASRGYAVFQPNYRGSTGYGQALLKAGYGQWGRKMQTDITDGLKAIADQGIVDPKRACIVGASYGGYAALAGVTVQHGFYRCSVSVAGVSDLNAMLNWVLSRAGYEQNSASRYWNVAMGARSADDPALHDISPFRLAATADAPVLLIYGRDDTVVPNDQSVRMERALRASGKPVETVVLDKEDHWLSREASRTQMLKAALAFVEKYDPATQPRVAVEPAAP